LDGRTNAAKYFDRVVAEITGDLGGAESITTIERTLIEGFAGATVMLEGINARIALGQPVEPEELSQAASTLVRIATRLGLARRARDVTGPSLKQLIEAGTWSGQDEGTPAANYGASEAISNEDISNDDIVGAQRAREAP
jgi:hypothetical protein